MAEAMVDEHGRPEAPRESGEVAPALPCGLAADAEAGGAFSGRQPPLVARRSGRAVGACAGRAGCS